MFYSCISPCLKQSRRPCPSTQHAAGEHELIALGINLCAMAHFTNVHMFSSAKKAGRAKRVHNSRRFTSGISLNNHRTAVFGGGRGGRKFQAVLAALGFVC